MQKNRAGSPNAWRLLNSVLTMIFAVLLLLLLTACAGASRGPIYISDRPKLAPLPPEVLRAMRPNSTDSLKRASEWSRNSRHLLDSVTGN